MVIVVALDLHRSQVTWKALDQESGELRRGRIAPATRAELPESWIPPTHILELRTVVRLRKTLIDQRTAWQQRIHAQLFHQGVPAGLRLRSEAGREALRRAELSPARREVVEVGLR